MIRVGNLCMYRNGDKISINHYEGDVVLYTGRCVEGDEIEFLSEWIGDTFYADSQDVGLLTVLSKSFSMFRMNENEPDGIDRNIAKDRIEKRDAMNSIRVGDFLRMHDGSMKRVANCNRRGVQPTRGGSFALCSSGCTQYSGGLDSIIDHRNITPTDEVKNGTFWIEHHGVLQCACAVGVRTPCRVYDVRFVYE